MIFFQINFLLKIITFTLVYYYFLILKKKLLFNSISIERNCFLKEINAYIQNYLLLNNFFLINNNSLINI